MIEREPLAAADQAGLEARHLQFYSHELSAPVDFRVAQAIAAYLDRLHMAAGRHGQLANFRFGRLLMINAGRVIGVARAGEQEDGSGGELLDGQGVFSRVDIVEVEQAVNSRGKFEVCVVIDLPTSRRSIETKYLGKPYIPITELGEEGLVFPQ